MEQDHTHMESQTYRLFGELQLTKRKSNRRKKMQTRNLHKPVEVREQ